MYPSAGVFPTDVKNGGPKRTGISEAASQRQRQKGLWVAAADLPQTAAHPFYRRLGELLDEHGFDEFAELLCEKFYAARMGRPSLTPSSYFRCLLIGYLEGIDSERGIAWRLADSISLRRFLAIELDESTPDHSTNPHPITRRSRAAAG